MRPLPRRVVGPLREVRHANAAMLTLIFVAMTFYYSFTTPLWEAPDEVGHFEFIRFLIENRSLPVIETGNGAHQPPLHYLLAAIPASLADTNGQSGAFRLNPNFIWTGNGGRDSNAAIHSTGETFPWEGQALALRLARGVSPILGAITIVLVYVIGRRAYPDRPSVAPLAVALVAFNPQFLFIHGVVNNDVLATTASTAVVALSIFVWRAPERLKRWIALGVAIGIAVLSKSTTAAAIPVVAGSIVAPSIGGRSARTLIRAGIATATALIAVAGWWFARNTVLYGDPIGRAAYHRSWAINVRSEPLVWADLARFGQKQFESFWGSFGWDNIPAPERVRAIALLLTVAGVVGLIRELARSRSHLGPLALLGAFVVSQELLLIGIVRECNDSCFQGRYLFPAIGPLAVLVAVGILATIPTHLHRFATLGIAAVLAVSAALIPARVIVPAYAWQALTKAEALDVPRNVEAYVGDALQLIGYSVANPEPTTLRVTLYWRTLGPPGRDDAAFVHLLGPRGDIVAQKDQTPGADRSYPMSMWISGDVVADAHDLAVPSDIARMSRLRVGLYDRASGSRRQIQRHETIIGTDLVIPVSDATVDSTPVT